MQNQFNASKRNICQNAEKRAWEIMEKHGKGPFI